MIKIFIEKNADTASIIEQILEEAEQEIVLVVPKNARLKDSIENFGLIRREAAAAGKTLYIESVDEEVLAFGRMHKMESAHPLFSGKSRSLSDIVVSGEPAAPARGRGAKGKKVSLRVEAPEAHKSPAHSAAARRNPVRTEEEESMEEVEEREEKFFKAQSEYPAESAAADDEELADPPRRGRKVLVFCIGLGIVLIAGVWIWSTVGARAEVVINFKYTGWNYAGTITAATAVSRLDAGRGIIPAEIFSDRKNVTQLFAASGKAKVSQKATARIRIYNAYSSAPQTLVATTRFTTPDGKIFRLDKEVVVPGASVKDGQITPASIEAAVTADKVGAEYNVGPLSKLNIPGFQGTPRYAGFYGALESAASGGFVGERAVPTEADITAAKKKVEEVLAASFSKTFLADTFKDFTVLDGAHRITITSLTVKKETDDKGQFSVFGEASYQAFGFRESDVRGLLHERANAEHADTSFRDLELGYKNLAPDYNKGALTLSLSATGTLATEFSASEFKESLAGKSLTDARSAIAQLPGLADAKVSVRPLWLQGIPKNIDHIEITSN